MFKRTALALSSAVLLSACGSVVEGSTTSTPTPPKPPANPVPAGWQETNTAGVYQRWCTNTCDSSKVIGDAGYVILQVWCKEQACGDIYGRVNLLDSSGTVVGWTNDTGYGDTGQKVQLTFSSYQDFAKAQLTELNFRS
jgi:hypothetical protein